MTLSGLELVVMGVTSTLIASIVSWGLWMDARQARRSRKIEAQFRALFRADFDLKEDE